MRRDLEQIVLYHIGQTCDGIPDEYDPDGYIGIIPNSIILLSEVSNEENSLNVVLEILRQSLEFRDYHFGDNGILSICSAKKVFLPCNVMRKRQKERKSMICK